MGLILPLAFWDASNGPTGLRHLAHFTFHPLSASSPLPLKVTIYPTTGNSFTFTIHPLPSLFSFSFPFSSSWTSYLGLDGTIVQPPLPQGTGESKNVEVGTQDWKASSPVLKSSKTRGCWVDMKQDGTNGEEERAIVANWWPGLGRWKLGLWLDNAVMTLGEPREVRFKSA